MDDMYIWINRVYLLPIILSVIDLLFLNSFVQTQWIIIFIQCRRVTFMVKYGFQDTVVDFSMSPVLAQDVRNIVCRWNMCEYNISSCHHGSHIVIVQDVVPCMKLGIVNEVYSRVM